MVKICFLRYLDFLDKSLNCLYCWFDFLDCWFDFLDGWFNFLDRWIIGLIFLISGLIFGLCRDKKYIVMTFSGAYQPSSSGQVSGKVLEKICVELFIIYVVFCDV